MLVTTILNWALLPLGYSPISISNIYSKNSIAYMNKVAVLSIGINTR